MILYPAGGIGETLECAAWETHHSPAENGVYYRSGNQRAFDYLDKVRDIKAKKTYKNRMPEILV
ncbi:hypothetical protein GCM10010978_00010 [Compostibacillus humi]|uniref:Uncharacterized protein n=1 Tax=Compostibacillus humi TaxID=1245525 RepID=A0A8J2ZPP4_9BACI|nr:hypothetical protein GCM10010978_00010 [Compostibacillus humi]